MNNITATQKAATGYAHYDKFIEPDDTVKLENSMLKWYNLAKPDEPVSREISGLARAFLEKESEAGNLKDLGEFGFVILHRCGEDFYFLLVNSWRNDNELWETVYAKDGQAQKDFQSFTFQSAHRATFCVWELVAVWHEQQARKRYLLSSKEPAAKQNYLQDYYRGAA